MNNRSIVLTECTINPLAGTIHYLHFTCTDRIRPKVIEQWFSTFGWKPLWGPISDIYITIHYNRNITVTKWQQNDLMVEGGWSPQREELY